MAICFLTEQEALKVELHGGRPNCRHHLHFPKPLVEQKVADGFFRWVGDGKRRCTDKIPLSKARTESYQGSVLHALSIEQYPQVVQGGLTRNEHKPT